MSQTQLANIMAGAGIVTMIAGYFGYGLNTDSVAFILAAGWSLMWQGYNYYQRFKKGDLNLLGGRK